MAVFTLQCLVTKKLCTIKHGHLPVANELVRLGQEAARKHGLLGYMSPEGVKQLDPETTDTAKARLKAARAVGVKEAEAAIAHGEEVSAKRLAAIKGKAAIRKARADRVGPTALAMDKLPPGLGDEEDDLLEDGEEDLPPAVQS